MKNEIIVSNPTVDLETGEVLISPFLRTSLNFALGNGSKDVEQPYGISLTVPDMAMSLKELLEKHTIDTLPSPIGEPMFYGDEIPNFKAMDITERDEWLEWNKQRLESLEDEILQAQLAHDEAEKLNKEESTSVNSPSGAKPAGHKRAQADTDSEAEERPSNEA